MFREALDESISSLKESLWKWQHDLCLRGIVTYQRINLSISVNWDRLGNKTKPKAYSTSPQRTFSNEQQQTQSKHKQTKDPKPHVESKKHRSQREASVRCLCLFNLSFPSSLSVLSMSGDSPHMAECNRQKQAENYHQSYHQFDSKGVKAVNTCVTLEMINVM